MASFTCNLPQNTDNTPILEAGEFSPEVMISGLGYIELASGVAALT